MTRNTASPAGAGLNARDILKAVGYGVLALFLEMAASYVVIWTWSLLLHPGEHPAYYYDRADEIISTTRRIAGPIAFFLVVFRWGGTRPGRNVIAFAPLVWFFGLAIQGAMAGFQGFFTLEVALFAGIKLAVVVAASLLATMIGHWRARSRQPSADPQTSA